MKEKIYDAAVIGGGLAGMSIAYFLAKAGKSVAVFEANKTGQGATKQTTAFLTCLLDTSLVDLQNIFGKEKAQLAWQSHQQAIEAIGQIIKKEKIDCDFLRCSSFYYANSKKEWGALQAEYQLAKEMGFPVALKKKADLPFLNEGAVEIKEQAKFKIEKYMGGLTKAAKNTGVEIFEYSEVTEAKEVENGGWEITANQKPFLASHLVIASYYPFGPQSKTHFKKGMYVTYVLELEVQKGLLQEAIFEDTENPYHYFRIDSKNEQHDSVVLGGEDHREEVKADEEKKFSKLEAYFKKIFPGVSYRIASRWTGPILEPADGLAFIGNIGEHKYLATAFSGNGMTYSPIAAQIIADRITGKKNPYQDLYNPRRLLNAPSLVIKGRDFLEENFNSLFKD